MIRRLIIFSLIAHVLAIGVAHAVEAAHKPGTVISRSYFDIDGDGKKEKIEIVLDQGKRYRDSEPWCGVGEKWEGEFSIRVSAGKKILSTQSLNKLFDDTEQPASLFFWTPEFKLVFRDYNGDGQIDFNLGQYGSCNGNTYRLFTITPGGRISLLPIENGNALFISPPGRINSTKQILAQGNIITHSYYDNSSAMTVTVRHIWNGAMFVPLPATERKP